MQSVDLGNLERFDKLLQGILDEVPDRRRQLHEKIAESIKDEVDIQIARSGLNDSSGRIKEWQEQHVGSSGGYAAVRAKDNSTGANSPGAITNYLENGHRIREPSGKSKYYRPHIKTAYVDGFHFYASASNVVEAKALAIAEEYVNNLVEKMEG